jgi:DNA mismatch endonuclease, patch repair protein
MDHLSPKRRSWLMAQVKGRNTAPELVVRRMLHALGYRYRLHRKDLPGNPDIVFGPRKKAVFIHGCFWHGHRCRRGKLPKSNASFWKVKIKKNKLRDRRNIRRLRAAGWGALTVWQCQLKDVPKVRKRIIDFLG